MYSSGPDGRWDTHAGEECSVIYLIMFLPVSCRGDWIIVKVTVRSLYPVSAFEQKDPIGLGPPVFLENKDVFSSSKVTVGQVVDSPVRGNRVGIRCWTSSFLMAPSK